MHLFRSKNKTRNIPGGKNASPVFSYYSNRNNNTKNIGRGRFDDEVKQDSLGRRRFFSTLLLIFSLGVFGYSLFLHSTPRIHITKSDNVTHYKIEVYQEGINNIWQSSLMNRFKLSVQSAEIKRKILSEYPELIGVEIDLPVVGKRPSIVLIPATANLIIVSEQGEFYLDENGKVLAETDKLSSLSKPGDLLVIQDKSGFELSPGLYALNKQQVHVLRSLVTGLNNTGYQVDKLELPAVIHEVDVKLKNHSYLLRFSLEEDPEQGVGALLAFQDTIKNKTQPSSYVDLRVPTKAFYR